MQEQKATCNRFSSSGLSTARRAWRGHRSHGKSWDCRWRCLAPINCWSAPSWLKTKIFFVKVFIVVFVCVWFWCWSPSFEFFERQKSLDLDNRGGKSVNCLPLNEIPPPDQKQKNLRECQKVLIELRRSVIRDESLEWVTLQDPSKAFLKVSEWPFS